MTKTFLIFALLSATSIKTLVSQPKTDLGIECVAAFDFGVFEFMSARKSTIESVNIRLEPHGITLTGDYEGSFHKTTFRCKNGHNFISTPLPNERI